MKFQRNYPAVYKHLLKYKKQLSDRNKDETGIRYEWYALQRCAASYWEEFEKPKIVYPDIAQTPEFCYDKESLYIGNTLYLIPTNEIWLLGILNSNIVSWFYNIISPSIQGGFLRFISQYMNQLPIPYADRKQQKSILHYVGKILATKEKNPHADVSALEREIDLLVYQLYGLTEEEIKIVEGKG